MLLLMQTWEGFYESDLDRKAKAFELTQHILKIVLNYYIFSSKIQVNVFRILYA